MFHLFCASPLNIESEMIFTPFCIAEATSSHEYQLVNLMDDSTVSNETQITTVLPAMTFHSEKKSIDYEGNMYIFSCPMTAKDYDFYTQVIHWLEQETSTTIVNGKEYISSENGKKIHVFEVERRLKERYEIGGEFRNFNVKSAKTWVAMGLVGAKVAFILYKRQKYLESTRILETVAENDEFTIFKSLNDEINIKYLRQKVAGLSEEGYSDLLIELRELAEPFKAKAKTIQGKITEFRLRMYNPTQVKKTIKKYTSQKAEDVETEFIEGGDEFLTRLTAEEEVQQEQFLQTVANNKAGEYERLTTAEENEAKQLFQYIRDESDEYKGKIMSEIESGTSVKEILEKVVDEEALEFL